CAADPWCAWRSSACYVGRAAGRAPPGRAPAATATMAAARGPWPRLCTPRAKSFKSVEDELVGDGVLHKVALTAIQLARAGRQWLTCLRGLGGGRGGLALLAGDAHAVERAHHEDGRDAEEGEGEDVAQPRLQRHRQLDGEEAEQRGELDDRVHRHRRGILE